jgi:hypothetical protein
VTASFVHACLRVRDAEASLRSTAPAAVKTDAGRPAIAERNVVVTRPRVQAVCEFESEDTMQTPVVTELTRATAHPGSRRPPAAPSRGGS